MLQSYSFEKIDVFFFLKFVSSSYTSLCLTATLGVSLLQLALEIRGSEVGYKDPFPLLNSCWYGDCTRSMGNQEKLQEWIIHLTFDSAYYKTLIRLWLSLITEHFHSFSRHFFSLKFFENIFEIGVFGSRK